MSWRKEKSEHPWATKMQAKRIAHDHAVKKKSTRHPKGKGSSAIQTAKKDFTSLEAGAKRITYGKHEAEKVF
ncbi:MAG: hypothetical protein ABSB71_08010 [Candidatus Bathyarchaeia archaeon]|jgi:hypothetical protein